MEKIFFSIPFLLSAVLAFGQKWVDKTYSIQTAPDIVYGTATDFAGNQRTLRMDISVPTDDVPPPCGRPLLVAVHGGAFLGGDKSEATLQNWMKDFARRGYVTASVNYRLGMFQTHYEVHCNVTQILNIPWDCSNMADTTEWYRGAYRAMQDVRGAIRYLVNNRLEYKIDPNNVFLVGESAGGFTVLNVAYLDDPSEKPAAAHALPDVLKPNKIYEQVCVQKFGWNTDIASMKLARPDLGPIEGTLNLPSAPYTLRGVGNFYGAALGDLFSKNTYEKPPVLYMFHQPNDLIVPFKKHRVLESFTYCLTQFPTFCSGIINRPYVSGSQAIQTQLDAMKTTGKTIPDYLFQFTNNQAGCLEQFTNPSLGGHAIDNYDLRTGAMAKYFALQVDRCQVSTLYQADGLMTNLVVSPNPVDDVLTVAWGGSVHVMSAELLDAMGRVVFQKNDFSVDTSAFQIPLHVSFPRGVYVLRLMTDQGIVSRTVAND